MRQYLIQQWNNADTFDYSGKQINHFCRNGAANIKAYEEKEEIVPFKVDLRTLPEKRLDSLDLKRSKLDKALASGQISQHRYDVLIAEWEMQYERAMKRLDKQESMIVQDTPDFHAEKTENSVKKDLTVFASGVIILLTAAMMVI